MIDYGDNWDMLRITTDDASMPGDAPAPETWPVSKLRRTVQVRASEVEYIECSA